MRMLGGKPRHPTPRHPTTRRPTPRRRAIALLALATLLAAGCSTTVTVEPLALPDEATTAACAALVAGLPQHISAGDQLAVQPDPHSTSAWGSPPVVLRCGDGVPQPGPTDQLLTVNGLTWLVDELTEGEQYTTVDRRPGVTVSVPQDYQPTASLIAELSPAVLAGTDTAN